MIWHFFVTQTIRQELFLRKKKYIEFGKTLKSIIPSLIKILLYSAISSVPLIILKERIYGLFTYNNSILRLGIPLIINTGLFFIIYAVTLTIFKEQTVKRLLKIAKRK